MKRILFLLLCMFTVFAGPYAQDSRLRSKYINFSFPKVEMKQDLSPDLKSNFGAGFTVGRTFYVHKQPVAGMIRFGIDATWLDLNYTSYKVEYRYAESMREESETTDFHQAEIGMQVGPSITVNPVGKLNVHGYFRYSPAFSALYDGETVMGNYATFFTAGGTISYSVIGLGIEARFGNCKYREFGGGNNEDEEFRDSEVSRPSLKRNFSGLRFYLSFRF